jgi:hypothetical protein
MSYAQAAAHAPNTPDPRPDPALLVTPEETLVSDGPAGKVHLVPNAEQPTHSHGHHYRKDAKDRFNKYEKRAEEEGNYLWELTRYYVFRPGVAGGLMGIGPSFLCDFSGGVLMLDIQ